MLARKSTQTSVRKKIKNFSISRDCNKKHRDAYGDTVLAQHKTSYWYDQCMHTYVLIGRKKFMYPIPMFQSIPLFQST